MHQTQSSHQHTIRIANLVAYCQSLQTLIYDSVLKHPIEETEFPIKIQDEWIHTIHRQILQQMERLDRSLKRRRANPTQLPLPTYRAYIWLRFLSKEENLLEHLQALHGFTRLVKEVQITNWKIFPARNYCLLISLSCTPYIYHTQVRGLQLKLTINECLLRAPTGIKREILQAALDGNRNSRKLVKAYCSSPGYQRMDELIRGEKHGQGSSPKGTFVDLEEVFTRINQNYFHKKLEKPQLAWSQKRTYRRLGSYSAQTDTVVISRTFDQASVPDYVLDFIMYHELLHKKLGIKKANSGKHNHNKKFKDLEKQYFHFARANEWLKQFSKKLGDFKYN